MISETRTEAVRKSIRRYMDAIPEDEPVIDVTLAAILCNFEPHRTLPIWMSIIGPAGIGKSDLLKLLIGWEPHVWPLPDKVSEGYWVNAKNADRSAIKRIEQAGARILLTSEMGSFGAVDRNFRHNIYNQLIGIHDGHLIHETGFDSRTIIYGPHAPNQCLGFLGAWTQEFYEWQAYASRLGSRFMAYYRRNPAKHWTDSSTVKEISKSTEAERAPLRRAATESLHGYLNSAITELNGFESVRIFNDGQKQLADATALVTRITSPLNSNASSTRLNQRVFHLVKMLAWMDGQTDVHPKHIAIGIRIAFSQIPPTQRAALRFAIQQTDRWSMAELTDASGIDRRSFVRPLESLRDLGVLKRSQSKVDASEPYRYWLSDHARRLISFGELM